MNWKIRLLNRSFPVLTRSPPFPSPPLPKDNLYQKQLNRLFVFFLLIAAIRSSRWVLAASASFRAFISSSTAWTKCRVDIRSFNKKASSSSYVNAFFFQPSISAFTLLPWDSRSKSSSSRVAASCSSAVRCFSIVRTRDAWPSPIEPLVLASSPWLVCIAALLVLVVEDAGEFNV